MLCSLNFVQFWVQFVKQKRLGSLIIKQLVYLNIQIPYLYVTKPKRKVHAGDMSAPLENTCRHQARSKGKLALRNEA